MAGAGWVFASAKILKIFIARSNNSDGEKEVVEGDAQAPSTFALLRMAVGVAG